MTTGWYLVQIVRRTAVPFAAEVIAGVGYFGLPLVLGLATRAFFDALSGDASAGANVWTVLALLLLLELVRAGLLAGLDVTTIDLRYAGSALLRANLLRQLLRGPGALPLPDSSGEAISRFRDDAESLMYDAIDGWCDLVGRAIFAVAAFGVMARIDAPLALAVAAMLALSVPIVTLAGDRVATYRRQSHEAIGRVTGFLAEIFAGAQAVKAAGATGPVVAHLARLGEQRRRAAVRDQLWQAVVTAVDANVVTFGIGLVLLLAGQALRDGRFTVGDFSLFVVYLTDLMWLPEEVARFFTSYRQSGVALERMAHLLGDADPRALVDPLPTPSAAGRARGGWSAASAPTRTAGAPPARSDPEGGRPLGRRPVSAEGRDPAERTPPALPAPGPADAPTETGAIPEQIRVVGNNRLAAEREALLADATASPIAAAPEPGSPSLVHSSILLEAHDLTYRHPTSGQGIQEVSLRLARGSFLVIDGPVAAGKTTLLQVLLGLLPRDAGEIRWRGAPVADPTAFFGPPRTSYLPQTPRLFSETLRANLQQGWAADDAALTRALHRAVLEHDLAALSDGWETCIGSRGARLSGGQVQRAAAARAFLRAPDLLVLDDLSSALDLPTEELLWERLAEWRRESPGLTILAVSHRPAARQRADRILWMAEGRLSEEGLVKT